METQRVVTQESRSVLDAALPVPQRHQCVLVQIRSPFLAVCGDSGLGHAQWLHAVGASMVRDVVVQLMSRYHAGGDGQAA